MNVIKFISTAFTPSRVGEFPETDEELERKTLTRRLIPRLPWFYASGASLLIAILVYFLIFLVVSGLFALFSSGETVTSGTNLIISFVSLVIAIITQAVLPSYISRDNQLVCVITGWGLAVLILIGAIVFNAFISF